MMSKSKSYVSTISGRDTSAAQFITELVMSRQAAKKGKDLPDKFWNMTDWKLEYKKQIVKANTFLKVYDPEVIIATLLSHNNKWINSLWLPSLSELIEAQQLIVDRQDHTKVLEYSEDINSHPGKKYGEQSKISRMRELENE